MERKKIYIGSTNISALTDTTSLVIGEFSLDKYYIECLGSWVGKKVAFLGDSITEGVNADKRYWQYLEELIGISSTCYGISGAMWKPTDTHKDILTQAQSAVASGIDFDAVFMFAGVNDFYNDVPLGEWWTEVDYQTQIQDRGLIKKRVLTTGETECEKGYINDAIKFVKQNYPRAQVILMTPIHKGFAGSRAMGSTYSKDDELASNKSLLYLDSYVNAVREASSIWSCPLIDLYSDNGIIPWLDEYKGAYMNPKEDVTKSDCTHPSKYGHWRIARTIASKLISIPCGKFEVKE